MAKDAPVLPGLSPVAAKPVRAAFDGGRLTSDAGVLVLAEIERRLGIAERLARCLADPRDPQRARHTIAEMIRFRALLIAAGYPDANDCDALRADPAFKLAVGRLPESGADLCSQPTMSRLKNLPGPTALKRMMAALVELFCDSLPRCRAASCSTSTTPWTGSTAARSSRASTPTTTAAASCRSTSTRRSPASRWPSSSAPAKPPTGPRCSLVLRHVVRAIRARWPRVEILIRGDSHYARPEAMAWCERHRVGYIFGLAGNKVLLKQVAGLAEDAAMSRVAGEGEKVRRYGDFRYAAGTWEAERRVIARVEASDRGTDSRFIVTNVAGAPRWLYEAVYCARGRAENLVKAHKTPPRLRPDLLHQGHGEPVPARAAHGRVLAPAHPARLGAENLILARGAARHAPLGADQGGRARHRAGDPDQGRAALQLSPPERPDAARGACRQAPTLSRGAACPDRAHLRIPMKLGG
jgi:hypothetical protein